MNQKLYITLIRVIRTFAAAFVGQMVVTMNPYSKTTFYAATTAAVIAVLNLVSAPAS